MLEKPLCKKKGALHKKIENCEVTMLSPVAAVMFRRQEAVNYRMIEANTCDWSPLSPD